MAKIVDHHLRPVDEAAASYVQDTSAVLRKIKLENCRGPQPKGTKLFTLDAIAMYPSIPTTRAPEWVKLRCLRYGMDPELVDWIIRAIELLLRCNTFEYDGHLYCQATGTTIGAPCAGSYADCAMAKVCEPLPAERKGKAMPRGELLKKSGSKEERGKKETEQK